LKSLRSRLSYANVMSTIAVFLVLGGATAFAAAALAPNSVGPKQLQQEAVTRAKIRSAAVSAAKLADASVTAAKLADGAVDGAKLASGAVDGAKLANGAVTAGKIGAGAVGSDQLGRGSVTADKLDPALVVPPVPHVRNRLVGTQPGVQFPTTFNSTVRYPFDSPTFTQPAGEDDMYIGAITARFGADCKAPRAFQGFLERDTPGALGGFEVLGMAVAEDQNGSGELTKTAYFGALEHAALTRLGASSPISNTLTIRLSRISCATGSSVGATATVVGSQVDVVGIR